MPNSPHMALTYHAGLTAVSNFVSCKGNCGRSHARRAPRTRRETCYRGRVHVPFRCVPRLLWRDAQGIEGSLDLASAEIKVGRAMDCAIRTDDAMVSRHHARIFWGGGGYVLEDLSSAHGVYFQEPRVPDRKSVVQGTRG